MMRRSFVKNREQVAGLTVSSGNAALIAILLRAMNDKTSVKNNNTAILKQQPVSNMFWLFMSI